MGGVLEPDLLPEKLKVRPDRPTDHELSSMFSTTKHIWRLMYVTVLWFGGGGMERDGGEVKVNLLLQEKLRLDASADYGLPNLFFRTKHCWRPMYITVVWLCAV